VPRILITQARFIWLLVGARENDLFSAASSAADAAMNKFS
jgi:hypothetical protein